MACGNLVADPSLSARPIQSLITRCSELAESIRAELAAYVKSRTDEILNLNNLVARLKKELEGHEAEAMVQVSTMFPLALSCVGLDFCCCFKASVKCYTCCGTKPSGL
jgi:hypothetical protein